MKDFGNVPRVYYESEAELVESEDDVVKRALAAAQSVSKLNGSVSSLTTDEAQKALLDEAREAASKREIEEMGKYLSSWLPAMGISEEEQQREEMIEEGSLDEAEGEDQVNEMCATSQSPVRHGICRDGASTSPTASSVHSSSQFSASTRSSISIPTSCFVQEEDDECDASVHCNESMRMTWEASEDKCDVDEVPVQKLQIYKQRTVSTASATVESVGNSCISVSSSLSTEQRGGIGPQTTSPNHPLVVSIHKKPESSPPEPAAFEGDELTELRRELDSLTKQSEKLAEAFVAGNDLARQVYGSFLVLERGLVAIVIVCLAVSRYYRVLLSLQYSTMALLALGASFVIWTMWNARCWRTRFQCHASNVARLLPGGVREGTNGQDEIEDARSSSSIGSILSLEDPASMTNTPQNEEAREAEELFFDHDKLFASARMIQSLYQMGSIRGFTPRQRDILHEYQRSQEPLQTLASFGREQEGWKELFGLSGLPKHSRMFYRLDPKNRSILSVKMETAIDFSSVVPTFCALNEPELFTSFIPRTTFPKSGIESAKVLKKGGKGLQVNLVRIIYPWPLCPREIALRSRGTDDIEDHGIFFAKIDSLEPGEEGVVPEPDAGVERMGFSGGILVRRCPVDWTSPDGEPVGGYDNKALISIFVEADTKMPSIPEWFLDFSVGAVTAPQWDMLLKVGTEIERGERPLHNEKIRENKETYEWLNRIFDGMWTKERMPYEMDLAQCL